MQSCVDVTLHNVKQKLQIFQRPQHENPQDDLQDFCAIWKACSVKMIFYKCWFLVGLFHENECKYAVFSNVLHNYKALPKYVNMIFVSTLDLQTELADTS